jgi:hypothetical protein
MNDFGSNIGLTAIGDDQQNARIDIEDGALLVATSEQDATNSGEAYQAGCYRNDMTVGEVISLVLTTPNTSKYGHLSLAVNATAEASIEIFENPTTSGGVVVNTLNRDRNSSNSSGVTVKRTVVITATGTQMPLSYIGAGFGHKEKPIVMKKNASYLVRGTMLAATGKMALKADWYEYTNKQANVLVA